MSVFIGDKVSLGIGRESTRGTGVSAALWMPSASFDFQNRVNTQSIAGAQNKIIGTENEKVLQKYGQGTLGADLRANAVGYFLTQLFGDVDSVLAETGVYTHTFNLTHSNMHPTLSLFIKDANKSERFVRSAMESFTLNFTSDAVTTMEVGFMSEPAADQSSTPDFTTADYVFAPNTLTFKLAADQSSLTAADATVINNLSITFTKGADPDFGSGSNSPTDIYNQGLEITGSFERIFDADTEHDYVFDNTNRAMRLDWNDTDTTIGSSETPQLTLDLYNVNFTNFSRDITLGDIVRQTVEFKAHVEVSSGNVMLGTLTNTKANYSS